MLILPFRCPLLKLSIYPLLILLSSCSCLVLSYSLKEFYLYFRYSLCFMYTLLIPSIVPHFTHFHWICFPYVILPVFICQTSLLSLALVWSNTHWTFYLDVLLMSLHHFLKIDHIVCSLNLPSYSDSYSQWYLSLFTSSLKLDLI